jgi:alkylhydroperoxidase/carboxymuconolactone decarboxylase family protein YurZ
MTDRTGRSSSEVERLEAKYGRDLLDHPPLLTPERFLEKLAERDAVDQHFARISMEFVSGVCRRPALDPRSRYLAQIGQFAVSKSPGHLEDALRASIRSGVPARESLEAIHLTHIYSGETVLQPAITIFTRVAREEGVLDALRDDQLPLDGHAGDRDLDDERRSWPADLADDPRRAPLMEVYGWRGISTGIRYRGRTHLDILQGMDREDREFARLWLDFTYEGMYSRWVLDDKTRLLCTTADCLALGAAAAASARDHMQEALHFGNSPQELLDLVHMSGVFFGFPGMTAGRKALMSILEEEGRVGELDGDSAG